MGGNKLSELELAIQQKQAAQSTLRNLNKKTERLQKQKTALEGAIAEVDSQLKNTP